MKLRAVVRAAAPQWLLRRLHVWRARRHAQTFGRLPIADAFDRVYAQAVWGESADEASGSGSYGTWASECVAFVESLVAAHGLRSAVGVGCGDFNVGARLCALFERYEALDVSRVIIERNRRRFGHLRNVRFSVVDATREPLPRADLVMVRQVLQHLSNAQIEPVLRNAQTCGARLIVVAEHAIEPSAVTEYNVDLQTHSPGTRLAFRSCVRIDKPPLERPARCVRSIPADRPVLHGLAESLDVCLLEGGS
jgi:hypothetical protein